MQRRKKGQFRKVGTMALLMDGEIIEVHRFGKGVQRRDIIERYKRRIKLCRRSCEISIIYDLEETMKVYE